MLIRERERQRNGEAGECWCGEGGVGMGGNWGFAGMLTDDCGEGLKQKDQGA